MDRRAFVTGLGAVLAAPPVAEAQPTAKVSRIGVLSSSSATAYRENLDAFREGLRELRWIEGQNVVLDYRFAEGRLPQRRKTAPAPPVPKPARPLRRPKHRLDLRRQKPC